MVFNSLKDSVIGFGVFVIILSTMATVLTTVKGTQTANSLAANISDAGLSSLETFSDFNPVIVIFLVLGIILTLVGMFMGGRQ